MDEIVFNRHFQKDEILRALNIVKQFILKRKRILTGGMAIDFALKNKGKALYSDTKLPDYDFYSPQFHVDAYDIGML